MLPHRLCHRRLSGLHSQRSSVPQGNGGVFVLPEGFPDIFHRDAGRLSDLFLPLVGQAVSKNDEVMLFGDGSPHLPVEDVLQAEFDTVDPQKDGT